MGAVVAAALSLALVLGACSDDGDDAERSASSSTTSGASSSTAPAPTSTTAATPTTTVVPDDVPLVRLALRGDGLGAASFGDDPVEVVRAVAATLGAHDEDTGWQPAGGAFGTCPGTRVRAVRWGGLTALFTDGTSDYGRGEHFFQWRQVPGAPPLATVKGLGAGATRADAEALYEDVVAYEDELVGGPVVEVQVEGGRLLGFLDGGGTITNLEAGMPCGE